MTFQVWINGQPAAATCQRRHLDELPDEVLESLRIMAENPGLLREAALLTHPDRHPEERREKASAVTAKLLKLSKTQQRRR